MIKTGQQLQQQIQLSSEGSTNKNEGIDSRDEKWHTQAQTHPTNKVTYPVQHIVEKIMKEQHHMKMR